MSNHTCGIIGGVVLVVVAIIIGLVASSVKKLSTEEVGLQYDVHQRKLGTELFYVGLHLGPPGFKFITFPKVYRTISFGRLKCLNKDGLEINLAVQFQYLARLNGKSLRDLIMRYETRENYVGVVISTASEVIHQVCSQYTTTQLQSARVEFQNDILNMLKDTLRNELSAGVRDVQISNIVRPSQYESVVREKESAKQNIKVAEQERPRVLTAANTKLREAETQANMTLNRARTDARIQLTRANAEAQVILNAYTTEAKTYKSIMDNQKLTIPGILSYLTTRAIQTVRSPVYVNLDAPAKTTFP